MIKNVLLLLLALIVAASGCFYIAKEREELKGEVEAKEKILEELISTKELISKKEEILNKAEEVKFPDRKDVLELPSSMTGWAQDSGISIIGCYVEEGKEVIDEREIPSLNLKLSLRGRGGGMVYFLRMLYESKYLFIIKKISGAKDDKWVFEIEISALYREGD